jgi:ribosome-associated heat shock protein Hsp15
MDGTRIDKWLWAARFFKTRVLAQKACEIGRVRSNGVAAKPSREVKAGDTLEVTNEGGVYTVEVLDLSESRGAAAVAQQLYRESEASRSLRAKIEAERKANPSLGMGAPGANAGRPSKRDRRLIHSFRDGQ